jgi:Recombinase
MAAEYVRELSAKVLAGQRRLAANGYKLGGRAGFGLRRLLLDSHGRPKMILQEGEEKHLATDRVTYTLGPPEEVAIVREIFSMFLDQDMQIIKIARVLNERGITHQRFGPWDSNVIRRMLSHPKYTGSAVFNMHSQKFRTKKVCNPREQWVLRPNTFPAIVSQEVFDRTQAKLANKVWLRSNEQLLEELKTYIETHGRPLPRPKPDDGMASSSTYVERFGGMLEVYELLGVRPISWRARSVEAFRKTASLKSEVLADVRRVLADNHIRILARKSVFRVQGRGYFRLAVGRCCLLASGSLRWIVNARPPSPKKALIVIRLQPDNKTIKDFAVFSEEPKTKKRLWLSDDRVYRSGTVYPTANAVADAIVAASNRGNQSRARRR